MESGIALTDGSRARRERVNCVLGIVWQIWSERHSSVARSTVQPSALLCYVRRRAGGLEFGDEAAKRRERCRCQVLMEAMGLLERCRGLSLGEILRR
jgi:hypothetical protein